MDMLVYSTSSSMAICVVLPQWIPFCIRWSLLMQMYIEDYSGNKISGSKGKGIYNFVRYSQILITRDCTVFVLPSVIYESASSSRGNVSSFEGIISLCFIEVALSVFLVQSFMLVAFLRCPLILGHLFIQRIKALNS